VERSLKCSLEITSREILRRAQDDTVGPMDRNREYWYCCVKLIYYFLPMSVERTVVLLKPDALQRDLLGEIIGRFERKGLKIVALKIVPLTEQLLDEHYAHIADKPFYPDMKTYMMDTPVVAMILEGIEAISEVRKLVGSTNPRAADAGTIRADLSMNMPSNLVHASDGNEAAEAEVKRFFSNNEIFAYEKLTDKFIFREGV
jgi:nucleoside-diphosphate kinase